MTEIPYCELTLAVTAGCTKCSLGCQECFAIRYAKRLKGKGIRGYDKVVDKNGWTGHIELMPWNLDKPLGWKKPRRIFVNSMSDLFHPKVPFEFIDKLHAAMIMAFRNGCYHTYLIFTKRVKSMLKYYSSNRRERLFKILEKDYNETTGFYGINWPFPNLQLILSLSTQAEADKKIPILLQIPAAVRGLSIEPMLEPIDFVGKDKNRMGKTGYLANYFTPFFCNDCGRHLSRPPSCVTQTCGYCGSNNYRKEKSISWVTVGCESLPGKAGRFQDGFIEAARNLVGQCQAAKVPIYVKQIPLLGKVVRDINKFPKNLQYQEYPK